MMWPKLFMPAKADLRIAAKLVTNLSLGVVTAIRDGLIWFVWQKLWRTLPEIRSVSCRRVGERFRVGLVFDRWILALWGRKSSNAVNFLCEWRTIRNKSLLLYLGSCSVSSNFAEMATLLLDPSAHLRHKLKFQWCGWSYSILASKEKLWRSAGVKESFSILSSLKIIWS